MTLGSRLADCRKQKGLRQHDVAEAVGLTNTQLSNYENDYREPDLDKLMKLAEFYQVNIEWLITGEHIDLFELLNKEDVKFNAKYISEKLKIEIIQFIRDKIHQYGDIEYPIE